MKRIIVIIIILLLAISTFAQGDIKTASFKVDGNCDMCKKRIENAAYIKGVKRAEWNEETHQLTLVYRESKIAPEAILLAVAKAGHTSEKAEATEADYKKLPECCQYKTNSCNHH